MGVWEVSGGGASSGEVAHLDSVSSGRANVATVSDLSSCACVFADDSVGEQEWLTLSVSETVVFVEVVASSGLSPGSLGSAWLSSCAVKVIVAEPVVVVTPLTECSADKVSLDVVETVVPVLVVADVLEDLLGITDWGLSSKNSPARLSGGVWLSAKNFLLFGAWLALVDLWACDVDIDVDIACLVVGFSNEWSTNDRLVTCWVLTGEEPCLCGGRRLLGVAVVRGVISVNDNILGNASVDLTVRNDQVSVVVETGL